MRRSFCHRYNLYIFCRRASSRRRDQVAALHNHFVHRPLAAVSRGVLTLLNTALSKQVVALIERESDIGESVVEREPVPVRVSFDLLVLALVSIGLAQILSRWLDPV